MSLAMRFLNARRAAGLVRAAAAWLVTWVVCLGALTAAAQTIGPPPPTTPADPPAVVHRASEAALLDLGSRFLRRLADENVTGFGSGRGDAQGGGDEVAQIVRRYRAWSETYGQWARHEGTTTVPGDSRTTYGVVGGFGVTLAPGVTFGLAVDQGWTRVRIDSLSQLGRINLTQLAAQGIYEVGPWTLSLAGLHAFGGVDSSRATNTPALATASYDARMWGAIAEASYYWSRGPWRVVPKVGMDITAVRTDAFSETGGNDPITAGAGRRDRWRAFAGAEAGYHWWQGRTLFDLSGHARAVEILAQSARTPDVSSPSTLGTTRIIEGLQEARFGIDAGAAASVRFANALRLYAQYDGRFRHNAQTHGATLGLEIKW